MVDTTNPRLTTRFTQALTYAHELHKSQLRKGGQIPYFGHLLSVAGLVIEADGSETQAIAALLHDAAEDQGGKKTLAEIKARFGPEVAQIVKECSDTFETPKPPWRERKERYIAHLDDASQETILISLADKLDNARAILRDLGIHGPDLWQRFNQKDPHQHLWYYDSLLAVYKRRSDSWLVGELEGVLLRLKELIGPPSVAAVKPSGGGPK
jgi:(p)ppGpp synthase/HD superfamily hydrolase